MTTTDPPRLAADRPARLAPAGRVSARPTAPGLRFRANRLAMVGLGIVLALVADRRSSPTLIAPYDPVLGGDLRTERLLPPLGGDT